MQVRISAKRGGGLQIAEPSRAKKKNIQWFAFQIQLETPSSKGYVFTHTSSRRVVIQEVSLIREVLLKRFNYPLEY